MRKYRSIAQLMAMMFFALSALPQAAPQAQASTPQGAPHVAPQVQPNIPTTGFAGLDEYRASRIAVFTDDFGQLSSLILPVATRFLPVRDLRRITGSVSFSS